jgi:2-polyprenyl-3-methyl-5-hydroxy-6-metoxy-1,4-benzoquinol methylase
MLGCSTGILGKALKERQQAYVVGIEINPKAAMIARNVLDKVIVENVDTANLYEYNIQKDFIDFIVYGDVLEHCIDPWKVVKMHRDFLNEKGVVVASIPNVGHYTVLLNILGGNFPYRERGLHDKTHLRWFTKNTIVELFRNNYYDVTIVQRNLSACRKEYTYKKNRLS